MSLKQLLKYLRNSLREMYNMTGNGSKSRITCDTLDRETLSYFNGFAKVYYSQHLADKY